jgi:hypothetical protein
VDLRRAPAGVLLRQVPNQDANFFRDPRPANAAEISNANTSGNQPAANRRPFRA